jgi:putative protein-disulfide isomerase
MYVANQLREQNQKKHPGPNQDEQMGQVKINFYTDPLCCWSWAFEQHWRKLLAEYGKEIEYRYIMCGMIPDWKNYSDPVNSVSRPAQMGPVWMHASEVTNVKMNYSLWHEDPPSSSYPACIAVKAAGLQSLKVEDTYLFALRKAMMNDGANISKQEVLLSVAEGLELDDFDFEKFYTDWKHPRSREAFRSDLQKARFHSIGRFPTLTFTKAAGEGIIMTGYRPYEVLRDVFQKFAQAG